MSFEESSSPSATFPVGSAFGNSASIDVANLTPPVLSAVAVVVALPPTIPRTLVVFSTSRSPSSRIVAITAVVSFVAIRVVTIAPLASRGG